MKKITTDNYKKAQFEYNPFGILIEKYKGYSIFDNEDLEEDNRKHNWSVKTPKGDFVNAPIGPYEKEEAVRLWIDLGMPKHPENHYFKLEDLQKSLGRMS